MDLEKKKQLLVLLDPYGLDMAIPKEIESDKYANFRAIGFKIRAPHVGNSMKNFFRTREVGEFISGALSGAMTKAVLAPLETIRTRMVVGVGSKHIAGSFLQIIEENGWQGLWAGNTINMLRIIPTQAIEFTTFECVRRTITEAQEKWKEKPKLPIGHINIDLSLPWISPVAVGGAAAGIVSTLVCHPLEVIKKYLVCHVILLAEITVLKSGLGGRLSGNGTPQDRLEKWKEKPKLPIGHINIDLSLPWISPVAVGGAAAGIVSTLVCHPLEVIKDRLTVNREAYPTITLAFRKICKDDGIGGLYAGLSPTLIGMLPYSTCYYFMYETLKSSYCKANKKSSLNRAELLIIGALSGFTASTISFPLEVARKRLMVGSLQGKCPPHMAAALSEVIKERGLLGLYRGWGASCLKVMPSSGITWMFYEAWKDILLVDRHKI